MSGAIAASSTTVVLDPAIAFSGRIKRVWKSPLYFGALMVVALAMILLPVIYVGIVASAGYGVYYHATEHASLLSGGRGVRGRFLVYFGPLVIGGILLFFMIKPLFARPSRREKRVSLVRDHEPLLFAFVDRLCEVVGAPKPRRIDVDCQVNAAASFRHGLWSLFWPGDLVLTIGVPLAAGLSLSDFTGVLAHEFGHFAQSLGMRFTYLIQTVNHWFVRVVYERDSWDEWLDEQSRSSDAWVRVIMLLARIFIYITRGILFVLMFLGHMISCGMSRQMEFDADLHAIRTTGSESLVNTELRMALLSISNSAVFADLRASWRDRKLADNVPALVALKCESLPAEGREQILQKVQEEKTGWFDTHPSSAARIRYARKLEDPGVFSADGPATQLFSDFAGLSKAVTLSLYHDLIGAEVTPKHLLSTADVTRRSDEARRSREAADRYFFGCVTLRRPIQLDAHSAIFKLDEAGARGKLAAARKSLEPHASAIRERHGRFHRADRRLVELAIIEIVIKAGKRLDAKKCDLNECSLPAVAAARTATERERRAATDDLIKIEAVMRTRAEAALRLLSAESVAQRVRGIERLQRRMRELLAGLSTVANVADTLGKLRQGMPHMAALGQLLSEGGEDEDRIRQAIRLTESQHAHLSTLRSRLVDARYPFAHTAGQITLAQYALAKLPERQDFGGAYSAAGEALEAMEQLYARLLGEIAQICEAVEAAMGFQPIKTAAKAHASTNEAA